MLVSMALERSPHPYAPAMDDLIRRYLIRRCGSVVTTERAFVAYEITTRGTWVACQLMTEVQWAAFMKIDPHFSNYWTARNSTKERSAWSREQAKRPPRHETFQEMVDRLPDPGTNMLAASTSDPNAFSKK